MAKTLTNSEVDALAAAVPAPYGPLTRVTDFESLPEPNSEIHGDFTSQFSVTVSLTPAELTNLALTNERLIGAHDWTAVVAAMKTAIGDLKTLADTMSTPHVYSDYLALQQEFRDNFPWFMGYVG